MVYLVFLLLLNLFPRVPVSPVENGDKLVHLLMFFLLGLIGSGRWLYLLPLPFLTEFLQLLVPGRTFSFMDMAANLIGFLAGVLLGWWHEGHNEGTQVSNEGRD
ncbi:VanZ family protein [Thermococcus sp. M36]|nr:VanZ family protein [Thermococcus sp. M36]